MFKRFYNEVFLQHQDAPTFIVLVVFVITFIIARLMVYLIDAKVLPDLYVSIGQTHVHHLNFGIYFLSIAGYLSLVFNKPETKNKLAILYGIGLALTFDEFALWLHLQDDYYARISYEAIVVIAALLINIVYFHKMWSRIFRFLNKNARRIYE